MRNAERVETGADVFDDRVDLRVGPRAADVGGPAGEDVTETVDLGGHPQEGHYLRVLLVPGGRAVLERVPERVPSRWSIAACCPSADSKRRTRSSRSLTLCGRGCA